MKKSGIFLGHIVQPYLCLVVKKSLNEVMAVCTDLVSDFSVTSMWCCDTALQGKETKRKTRWIWVK